MPLAECHNQDNKRVASDGTKRVSKTGKKVVQWKDVIVEEKIFEKYESCSEEESEQPLPSPPRIERPSMARRDTIAPSALYSTRPKGLRRLPPSPNPHFDSEQLQNQKLDGCRVRAVVKTELVFDAKTKMPATRFSTPLAVLDLAPPTSTATSSGSSLSSSSSRPASASSVSLGQTTPAMRRSTETIDSRRSSSTSSSSSMASHRGSLSPLPTSVPAPRFAVSGTLQGATKLETGLEGVFALLKKTHAAQIRAVHVQTADPVLADIVGNMSEHMRTEFATFAWPRLLTDRVQEILRLISVETIMVDVTIEYVPEKEGLFRRFSHQIKSVFNFIRSFR